MKGRDTNAEHRTSNGRAQGPLPDSKIIDPVIQETDELIRIFVASLRTANQRRN
jgi:hypothetical protein